MVTTIYCDGGCRKKCGSWAFLVLDNEGKVTIQKDGTVESTTNNKMELTAVINAVKLNQYSEKVKIFTDSQYVTKGFNIWSKKWITNGWQTTGKKPVLNLDLWKELLSLTDKIESLNYIGEKDSEYIKTVHANMEKYYKPL